ncbi:MAG: cadherin-like domain-containing protein [Thermoleophilaceae bacterium]|nr:cadherin-like domain-containing protein [Thermoleophilaceae bacterium]
MPVSRLFRRCAIVAGAFLLLAFTAGAALAAQRQQPSPQSAAADAAIPGHGNVFSSTSARRLMADGSGFAPAPDIRRQHGSPEGHLPSGRENVELVGKLEPTQQFGQIVPEQIADVTVHEGYAYLNSWADPTCTKGGVYVVDIRDPANPRELAFIPALPGSYHGEGAQVSTINTPAFQGDVLAVNNEGCEEDDAGGFDLYDVTDPRNPQILIQGFGDAEPNEGTLTGSTETANHYHNIRMWEHGGRAYIVGVDNFETHDVDIFEITNPRAPQAVAEFDLLQQFPQIEDNLALGNLVLNHDDVIKTIGGRPIMLLSYWDAGYVKLDVSDPANPVYIGDTTYDGQDPLTGLTPPEGNAHQVEFSADNAFLLAADEDFAPYRAGEFRITTGAFAGVYPSAVVPDGASPAALPDLTLNGPTVYGGYGCDASAPIPPRSQFFPPPDQMPRDQEAIVVLQRGPLQDPSAPEEACFPGEKAANAIEAGYDAVLLVNRHTGSADTDEPFCGSGGFPPGAVIVTMCTTHAAFHRIFGSEPQHELPVPPGDAPALGTLGERVEATSVFDGWGYAHLYENGEGKLRRIDSFAIEEALDPRFAFEFGDLSIHEFATDPTERLAYSSYYSGGFRVVSFGPEGLEQVGKFIDRGGNNFWGVEVFTTPQGERLVAASDRDFGLYIFRYTGPGAAVPPECEDVAVSTRPGTPVEVPLTCTDENNNPLTLSIASQPANGTLAPINQGRGTVTYTPNPGFRGTDSFTFRASDGAAQSEPATAAITVGRPAPDGDGACANPIVGTPNGELLDGTAAGDLILGRDGDDRMFGRGGDDCLDGEAGRDRVFGGAGEDQVDGGSGNDVAGGDGGADRVRGQRGRDRLSGDGGADRVRGGQGRDRLSGDGGRDGLYGDGGNDRVDATGGRDRAFGGTGNDRINAADGRRDRVDCGPGRDAVAADRRDRVRRCEAVLGRAGNRRAGGR